MPQQNSPSRRDEDKTAYYNFVDPMQMPNDTPSLTYNPHNFPAIEEYSQSHFPLGYPWGSDIPNPGTSMPFYEHGGMIPPAPGVAPRTGPLHNHLLTEPYGMPTHPPILCTSSVQMQPAMNPSSASSIRPIVQNHDQHTTEPVPQFNPLEYVLPLSTIPVVHPDLD
ncbi:hypothetical protein BJX99DRAFT_257748 [Aspergillus californicus]